MDIEESTSLMDWRSSDNAEARILQCEKMKDFAKKHMSSVVTEFAQIRPSDLYILYKISQSEEKIEYNLRQYDAIIKKQNFVLYQISRFLKELDKSGIERDYEFQTTCRKFLKHCLKALSVFNLPNFIHSHPEDLLEKLRKCFLKEMKNAVSGLVEILKRMPMNFSFETLSKLLPNLLDVLNNSHMKIFTDHLLLDSEMSSIFGAVLLDHYCDINNLRDLENKTPEDEKNYLSLLENVFEKFRGFPAKYKSLEKAFLDQCVNTSIRLVLPARYPIRYFSLLKKIFHVLLKFPDSFSDLTCLPFMMTAFNYWIDTPLEEETWHMLLELILLVVQSQIEQEYQLTICLLIKTVNFSLKGSDDLIEKALSLLSYLIKVVDLKFLNDIPDSLKYDLLHSLYDVLKYHPIQKICFDVAVILGKFGYANRKDFEDLQRLAPKENGGSNLLISSKDTEGFASIPFLCIIDSLLDLNASLERNKNCVSIADSFLDSYIIKKSNYRFTDDDAVEYGNRNFRRAVKNALIIKFVATESLGIDQKKKELNKFLEKVIRSVFKLNEHLDLYPILIEATLDVRCCMSKDSSRKISLNCFDAVIKVKDIENISDPIFSEHVMNIVIFLCHESPWESKLLGCKAIDLLLQESSYEYKYPMFLKPLLYVMSDLQGKVSFGSIVDASELLHKKLLPRIVASHTASNTGKEKSFDTTISILNEEIMSNNYLIRKEARKCFNSLSTISNKRVSDLVKSFGNAMPVASLIYLYEDFKFSKEAKFTISDKNKEDYFSQLKEICMSHLKHEENIKKTCHTSTGYNLKIQKCCGALHALCFNLVKNKSEEIFDIFCHAAHSPIHEILHAGLRCLEDILKNDKIQVSDKMMEELLLKFYGPFVEMEFLKVSNFFKLEFFLKMFPIQSVETVLKILRSIKKNIFRDSGNDMKMLKVKLEGGACWITILTIKTLAYVDQSVVEEVISFVIDIEKNLSSKNISSKLLFKGFRESLLKFCKTFFEGAVSYFMSKNLEIRKIFFEHL